MFVVRPREIGPSHPTVIDFPNNMYFRPEGGLTLVGLEDGNPLGESPDGDTDHAKPGFVERAIERICQRIPAMNAGLLRAKEACLLAQNKGGAKKPTLVRRGGAARRAGGGVRP